MMGLPDWISRIDRIGVWVWAWGKGSVREMVERPEVVPIQRRFREGSGRR